jgi:hypothetical protein
MIVFKPFNGFNFKLLNKFNIIESTQNNLEYLRGKIEDLYFRNDNYDYSTKGNVSWNVFDRKEGSMLEILINE